MTTTSETLNRAADLIEERGWTFGEGWPIYNRDTSSLCLEGGIMAAQGMAAETHDYEKAVIRCPAYLAVLSHLDSGFPYLFQWNDRKGRTAAEVIEVLRACALIEAAREDQDAAWETYAELVTT